VIKFREVRIAKKVKRSDAGDVSPVAMFFKECCTRLTHLLSFASFLAPTGCQYTYIFLIDADNVY